MILPSPSKFGLLNGNDAGQCAVVFSLWVVVVVGFVDEGFQVCVFFDLNQDNNFSFKSVFKPMLDLEPQKIHQCVTR
tara:strand:+ start:2860 stop:3090 length:231 start_codon:yes stop_codon:yes gene_type:complete